MQKQEFEAVLKDYQQTIQRLTEENLKIKKVKSWEHELTAIVDTREQRPLELAKYGIKIEVGTLSHGDYSLKWPDLRRIMAIERKSLDDFTACCGRERDRFEKEIAALRGYRYRAIICEFSLQNILCHDYRSQINPDSVIGSMARWMVEGIPFIMAENHEGSAYVIAKMMRLVAKDISEMAKASLV